MNEDFTAISGFSKEELAERERTTKKLEAFAIHILEECEKEGLTVSEVRAIPHVLINVTARALDYKNGEPFKAFGNK